MKVDYFLFSVAIAFLLLSCTIFFVVTTKNRVRSMRDNIIQINSQIAFQQKLRKELETEFFLRSESTRIKKLSDQHLDAGFTKVYQLLKISDLATNDRIFA